MVEALRRIVCCWLGWFALLGLPAHALAHQLDEYLQATLVLIEPGEIRLQMNLTPGVSVAEQVLGLMDQNHDGVISTNEFAAYATLVKRDLVAQLDGATVELRVATSKFPEVTEIRTGWGILQFEYSVATGNLSGGRHTFTLNNRHLPATSVYLFNAAQPGTAAIQIIEQKRNQNQSTGEIAFEFRPPPRVVRIPRITLALAVLLVTIAAGVWQLKREPKNGSPRNTLNTRTPGAETKIY